jgi:hypothetical protein
MGDWEFGRESRHTVGASAHLHSSQDHVGHKQVARLVKGSPDREDKFPISLALGPDRGQQLPRRCAEYVHAVIDPVARRYALIVAATVHRHPSNRSPKLPWPGSVRTVALIEGNEDTA